MITPPEHGWWRAKVEPLEKVWIVLAVILIVGFASASMPVWHALGKQNAHGDSYRVDPKKFEEETERFVQKYKIGEEKGMPVVQPPPGSDIYLFGTKFFWYPILKLKAGERYKLHVSSIDMLHGFSLHPHQWSIQTYPGYEWVLPFTPMTPGVYTLVCNDYCGIGHEKMLGQMIVTK